MNASTTIPLDDLATWAPDATAVYRLEGGSFLDRDIGGSDGWEWTVCRLEALHIGKLRLTREQACLAFGEDAVTRWEADELTAATEKEAA